MPAKSKLCDLTIKDVDFPHLDWSFDCTPDTMSSQSSAHSSLPIVTIWVFITRLPVTNTRSTLKALKNILHYSWRYMRLLKQKNTLSETVAITNAVILNIVVEQFVVCTDNKPIHLSKRSSMHNICYSGGCTAFEIILQNYHSSDTLDKSDINCSCTHPCGPMSDKCL